MLTGKELGSAIERARKKKGITKKELAQHFGVSPPSVQEWVQRGTIRKELLLGVWRYFEDVVPPSHWGLTAFPWVSAQKLPPGEPLVSAIIPPLITWEELTMVGGGTKVYRLALRDDALTPRLRIGDYVELTAGLTPKPGDGVLVRDALGGYYLRIYRERRPGEWSAAPLNTAYDVLDAAACGLTVVAVVTGEGRSGRWA